ncbi:MBL fold metallo-hydrolase [Hyperthermus butylicus]|uniref:Zinc-dependent hydrolase, glyoxylase II family n=1 Tax=Hyperthermus butylicus (strain DSM 5456 / JCM 9403 / PLM1-5) TaxID=415426 RepID=A2BJI6_HYPBU|nr:MBL fold metallo-hydrolase [Hyperthermus butylicus]ABM80147.1 zinc-dependent hydrolase, glyoxylase II family [Hyperthermus butylicus DSM 5456]
MAQLQKLSNRVYLLPGSPNTLIVLDNDKAYVVDPGIGDGRTAAIAEALGRLRAELAGIVLTHGHTDHLAAGLELVRPGVEVYAHRYCVPLVESMEARFLLVYSGLVTAELASMPLVTLGVTSPFDWGHQLPAGMKTLDLHGHTPGHTGILLEEDHIAAAGDAVLGEKVLSRFGIPFASNLREWYERLPTLRELAEAGYTIVPGHGPVAGGSRARSMVEANMAAVERVYNYVLDKIREMGGATVEKLTVMATRDLSAVEPTPRQLMLNRTAIHSILAWLHEEGKVEPIASDEGVVWKPKQL